MTTISYEANSQEAPTGAPAPSTPTPYHRLARTERHRWWKPILGTTLIMCGLPVVVMAIFAVASGVGMAAGLPYDYLLDDAEGELVLTLVSMAALIPLTLLAAKWIQRRPAGTLSSVTGRLRWRWMAACTLLAVPFLALTFAVMSLLPGETVEVAVVGWERLAFGLTIVLLLVPLQAAGEEYLFRGWLVQAFGSWFRSAWPGIIVSAVVFALAHGVGSPLGMVNLIFFGIVTAVVTIRTGGLEAAIALHTVNNVAAVGLMVVIGELGIEETAAHMPPLVAVIDMAVVALFALVVVRMARSRRFAGLLSAPARTGTPG